MALVIVEFNDVQGDKSFVKGSCIDCAVAAQHDVPVEVDENGQPKSDKTKLKFFVVAILSNGRQVLESFDTEKERDDKLEFVIEAMSGFIK